MFITKVEGSETRQRIDRDTAKHSTPQFNNDKLTKTKITFHKKMLLKDAGSTPVPQFVQNSITPNRT